MKCKKCGTEYNIPNWPNQNLFTCIKCSIEQFYDDFYERVIFKIKQRKLNDENGRSDERREIVNSLSNNTTD